MPLVATATEDDDLAAAVHRMLTSLTDLRTAAAKPEVLANRLALVRWLRQELVAVESLLTGVSERAEAAASTGTVTEADRR